MKKNRILNETSLHQQISDLWEGGRSVPFPLRLGNAMLLEELLKFTFLNSFMTVFYEKAWIRNTVMVFGMLEGKGHTRSKKEFIPLGCANAFSLP